VLRRGLMEVGSFDFPICNRDGEIFYTADQRRSVFRAPWAI
jgi:hypothetical protein